MSIMRMPQGPQPTPEMIKEFLETEQIPQQDVIGVDYSILEGQGLTSGEINIGKAILSDPTGTTLGRKVVKINNPKLLRIVVPQMSDEAIAHATDVNNYIPEIRQIMLAVPDDRLEGVLLNIKSKRVQGVVSSFVQLVPKVESVVSISTKEPQKYKITINGKPVGIIEALSYPEVLTKIRKPISDIKILSIESI